MAKVKTNMTSVLQSLLKVPEIFEFIKNDLSFYTKLVHFCREPNVEYNRKAFQLLFQLVRYHHGVLDHLIKINLLQPFLEIVGTSAGNGVIMNGLHYLSKLFSLNIEEAKRMEGGKPNSRNEATVKTFEKDVKTICKFFKERRLFIKIQMIYMRFQEPPSFPGQLFQELAHFYHTVAYTPTCQKLYKDINKYPEYREGIAKVKQMYTPNQVFNLPPAAVITRSASSGSISSSKIIKSPKENLSKKKLSCIIEYII